MIEVRISKSISNYVQVSLSLLILTFLLWLLKIFWDKRQFFMLAARIPQSIPSSKFGLSFIGKSSEASFQEILSYFQQSPEVFKFWMGYYLLVGISKPEHLEEIMTNPLTLNKSPIMKFLKPYLGNGLITAPMNIWKKHRKLINPVFNQKALNSFIPIFTEKCETMIGILENLAGQPDINIQEIFGAMTLDNICETAMGLKVDAQLSENYYGKLLEKGMEYFSMRFYNPFYHSQVIFDMLPAGKRNQRLADQLVGFTTEVITKRRPYYEEKARGEYINEENEQEIKTFLDLLLEISSDGDRFTDEELQDEVNTFIAAGTDTSSYAISFCCLMLGMHPEHQQKLYEEAIEVLGEDRYPNREDLQKLKFTELVIKETLRLFPIAPILVRTASGEIKIDDLVIPQGSTIFMSIINLHRNPKYWRDPLKFNPYRFSRQNCELKHPYAYLAFSGGPRGCIGQRYAMMFMKLIITKIVRKFRIRTGYEKIEDVQLNFKLMLRPVHGFKVTLELRE